MSIASCVRGWMAACIRRRQEYSVERRRDLMILVATLPSLAVLMEQKISYAAADWALQLLL
jgi:hypothetical protein